jgi:hypothetical protein
MCLYVAGHMNIISSVRERGKGGDLEVLIPVLFTI